MSGLLDALWRASVEGAVFGAAVWMFVRLVPATPPRVRVWLWWLVSARLLWALVPVPAVEIAPPPPVVAAVANDALLTRTLSSVAQTTSTFVVSGSSALLPSSTMAGSSPSPIRWSITWGDAMRVTACGVYLLVLVWQAWRLLANLRSVARLMTRANPAPPSIVARAAELAEALDVSLPEIRVSRDVRSPLVAGTVTSVVVLPERATSWSAEELDFALAHELAHVKYRDLVWAWVPALSERVFFFHPLARLAVREYVLAREAASDARAITLLRATPDAYGCFLLALGCAPASPLCAAARATSTFTTLKRRLLMLERATTYTSRWWWALVAAAAVTLVPLTFAATPDRAQPAEPPPAPAAPQEPIAPPAPPAPPVAVPPPPAPPVPPVAPVKTRTPWVMFDAGDADGSVKAASRHDVAEAARQRQGTEAMLWFKHDGVAYVSRDPRMMDVVRSSFSEVEALGARLSAMGERHGRHGESFGALGDDQGRLGEELARRGARIAELTGAMLVIEGERLQSGRREVTAEQAARLADTRTQIDTIRAEMEALAAEQHQRTQAIERDAARMREDATRMEAMGRDVRRAAEAALLRVEGMLDAAVDSGAATRVP